MSLLWMVTITLVILQASVFCTTIYLHRAKTHRGLRSEFARLARSEPRIDREYLTFLAEAYEYKSIADYAAGPATLSIGAGDASSAVGTASRFVECIAELLSESPV